MSCAHIHLLSSLRAQLGCLLPRDAFLDPPGKIQAGCLLSFLHPLHAILSMPVLHSLNFLPCVVCRDPSSKLIDREERGSYHRKLYFLCGCLCLESFSFIWRSPVHLLKPISFIRSPTSFLISFFPP